VPKRITITLDTKLIVWARRQAADENLSLSKFIARLIDKDGAGDYWRAYEEWKKLPDDLGGSIDASKRFTRDEVHERRGSVSIVQATSASREADQFDRTMPEMAADPQIRAECDAITRDFESSELDDSPED
jgi:hypothetical protein